MGGGKGAGREGRPIGVLGDDGTGGSGGGLRTLRFLLTGGVGLKQTTYNF